MDGDGKYTPGEPFGFLRDVDVGWDKVAKLDIELTDGSPVLPRFDFASGAFDRIERLGTKPEDSGVTLSNDVVRTDGRMEQVRIVRAAVNGNAEVRHRTVYTCELDTSVRTYLTEADILVGSAIDLDDTLVADAAKYGIASNAIKTATYAIVLGRETSVNPDIWQNNVLATFVNT